MIYYFLIGLIVHILLIASLLFAKRFGNKQGRWSKEDWEDTCRFLLTGAITNPGLIIISMLLWPLTLAIQMTLLMSVLVEDRP